MLRRVTVIVGVVLTIVVAVIGSYTQFYGPSQHAILTDGRPPVRVHMPVTPLNRLPRPDHARISATLRDAATTIKPDYRIDEELMFTHPGAWYPLRKKSGEYLRNNFGLHQKLDTEIELNGHQFSYLVWSAHWPRSLFDDRVVLAVEYYEPLTPDYRESMLGYFVMRPK